MILSEVRVSQKFIVNHKTKATYRKELLWMNFRIVKGIILSIDIRHLSIGIFFVKII